MDLTKRGVIHRHEDDFSSILYLSIDEVGYALDITLEGGRLWLSFKIRLCGERRSIGLGCVRHNIPGLDARRMTLTVAQPPIVHLAHRVPAIQPKRILIVRLCTCTLTCGRR
jgi:hypothetical protein